MAEDSLNYCDNVKSRLLEFIDYKGLNKSEFGRMINVSSSFITSIRKSISDDKAMLIKERFPEINLDWLLYNKGEMLMPNNKTDVIKDYTTIPLIHIDSVGGMWSENAIASSEQFVERMIPFVGARKTDVAIIHTGISMEPVIPEGSILHIRRVDGWQEYFGYGEIFVLWLKDDRRITKRVDKYSAEPDKYVLCHSFNPAVDDERLPKEMIKEVWKVITILTSKGW